MADIPSKGARIDEFFRRLGNAKPASTFDEAFALAADVLNAVEEELTGIPYNPDAWMIDGRMYPCQLDREIAVPNRPGVRGFRSVGHRLFVGDNGAIEIQEVSGRVVFRKPGNDGRTI